MDDHQRARQLRRRAAHLRDLAHTIEVSPVMRLDRYGDVDTWRGPRADLCRATLAANQHQLYGAVEDLRSHAWYLEHQAADIEAAAASRIAAAS